MSFSQLQKLSQVKDTFSRVVDYLRVSVTDRCNEKCLYCMPEGYRGWKNQKDHLSADELLNVIQSAAQLGFRKFRLTGGEPLLRKDLVDIVRRMNAVDGVDVIGLSTNGIFLASQARALREAGVRTINVSLDALTPSVYRSITGGDVSRVLDGIRTAVDVGFDKIKLNCVLMRGKNEDEILPLIRFAAEHELPLRFIELMPVTSHAVLDPNNFWSVQELMSQLQVRDRLIPRQELRIGHGPAKYYWMEKAGSLVGFIGAITNTCFCEGCNKMRLTADGKIRPCLGQNGEIDLGIALRNGEKDVSSLLLEAIKNKPEAHDFLKGYNPGRPMTAIGG